MPNIACDALFRQRPHVESHRITCQRHGFPSRLAPFEDLSSRPMHSDETTTKPAQQTMDEVDGDSRRGRPAPGSRPAQARAPPSAAALRAVGGGQAKAWDGSHLCCRHAPQPPPAIGPRVVHLGLPVRRGASDLPQSQPITPHQSVIPAKAGIQANASNPADPAADRPVRGSAMPTLGPANRPRHSTAV